MKLISVIAWLLYQVLSSALFFAWYARKHPAEAKAMLAWWKRLILRRTG